MTTATVSRWDRFRESFFWYSFKRDKVAIVSFAVLLLMVLILGPSAVLAAEESTQEENQGNAQQYQRRNVKETRHSHVGSRHCARHT